MSSSARGPSDPPDVPDPHPREAGSAGTSEATADVGPATETVDSHGEPRSAPTLVPHTLPTPSVARTEVVARDARVTGRDASLSGDARFEDFEILGLLGEGAFAKVYLARQVSLDRQVALKVSADAGQEARTMARLEHDHIVQVYFEALDAAQNLRLICMRYVAGTTLDRVIHALNQGDRAGWTGQSLLAAIDAVGNRRGEFDPSALRDREALGRADWVEAVAWIGARLADALAHAHRLGVLHRDVKPANILLTTYGRPLLTDFNVASSPHRAAGSERDRLGGSLGTMAPEHLDAFNPAVATTSAAVDERSDVYSLGVVLFELMTGRRPFAIEQLGGSRTAALRAMAETRRAGAPTLRADVPDLPQFVERVVRRCLEPEPARRYQTASELARALDGCRELEGIVRALPAADRAIQAAWRRPFTVLILLTVAPHLLGSTINIAYNATQIVGGLSARQQMHFTAIALGYNLVVYVLCLALATRALLPSLQSWRTLEQSQPMDAEEAGAARRRVLRLPLWAVWLSCLGWFPGGVIFPAVLWVASTPADPLQGSVFGHFFVSFWIAGLIALTYSFFGAQFVALRVLYPSLWVDPRDVRSTAARELAVVEPRLRVFQVLAALIPLASAALLIGLGPEQMSRSFRVLTTGLIVIGMAGIGLTHAVSLSLHHTLGVMTRGTPRD